MSSPAPSQLPLAHLPTPTGPGQPAPQLTQQQQQEEPVRDLKLRAVHQLSLFDWNAQ